LPIPFVDAFVRRAAQVYGEAMAEMFKVEVCYALPEKQESGPLSLPEGATLQQALEASGLLEKHPEIDLRRTSSASLPNCPSSTRAARP
jgi:hypothetical protein